jgi:hypothetical protein
MRPATHAERPVRLALLAGLGLAVACGGGGGGGPAGPDVTPPGVPVSSLIQVEPPIPSSIARLSGTGGAVEGNAAVHLANSSAEDRTGTPVTATAQAASDGTFTVSVPAQLGDRLELTAADAAGNVSGVLTLQAGPTPTTLQVVDTGDEDLLTLTTGEGAFNLPFPQGDERYTVVVQALSPVESTFPLTVSGSSAADVRALAPAAAAETPAGLESGIRAFERRVMPGLPRQQPGRRLAPADDPEVGSTRTFNVVNVFGPGLVLTNRSHFDEVTARLRYKGDHTLIYVDTRAEGPDVPDAVLAQVGDRFDNQTYEVNRAAFGAETDVDGNGRIIVLMTATVNAANTQETVDQGSLLTGFFFAIDLLFHPAANPFANDGEIFYTLVPDPDKEFGAAEVTAAGFAGQLDGTLAHEFEHMINASRRIAADGLPEAVWLDEGLAHYAETLNGIEAGGMVDFQNTLRSALWLQKPYAISMVAGEDNLEQRGAAWLLVAYLVERYGEGILRELVSGPFTGIPNIENRADTSFPFLFYRFTAALLLDGQGISSDPWFEFESMDVRQRFQAAKQFWTGTPRLPGSYLGIRNATVPGALSSSGISLAGASPAYFEIAATSPGTIPVVVRADRQSNLQVTIIRTQ